MNNQNIKKFLYKLRELSTVEPIPCIGGRSNLPTQPGLKVKGRSISLPVNQEELKWLCAEGERSPFGKGLDTILDTEVRRSIEFEAQDIKLLNPNWPLEIKQLLGSVATQMGIDFQVEAELFKLLVYREGGHFKLHQDTEKVPGMFATLIVQLPSRCKGGSLTCRFADKEYDFDFGTKAADSEFCIYYAAHYADVHHQVEKITQGARLVLIYNLIQPIKEKQLSAGYHGQILGSAKESLASVFPLLSKEQHAILLQHEYTEQSLSNLGFSAMKGQDRDLLKALLAINEVLPLEQKLHFMVNRVSYSVTSDGSGGYYGEYDEDDIHWEEIESSEPGSDLCFDSQGQIIPADGFTINWIHDLSGKEVSSTRFDKIDEDFWGEGYDDIEGFMGNYGPTKETTYARYLLLIMPTYPKHSDNIQSSAFQAHRVSLMVQDRQKYPECDWLQERFDKELKASLLQFKSSLSENDRCYFWGNQSKQIRVMFAALLKTAIKIDDSHLCQRLINTARKMLILGLSLASHKDSLLDLLKDAVEHFHWEDISAAYAPLLSGLSSNVCLEASIALAKGDADKNKRSQLMEICVNVVCREKTTWGDECGFNTTLVPLALNLCKTEWYATDKSKSMFLATCLKKGVRHPSFLSVLIQKLTIDTQANDKAWLLTVLLTTRLQYLERELKKKQKAFSWSMPNGNTQSSAVTDFLKSENEEIQITGYDGIAMARGDVVSVDAKWILPEFYMESKAEFLKPGINRGFSASMEAKGRGKKAYVEIKKDKRYYNLSIKLRELRKQELEKLKSMVKLLETQQ